MDPNIKTPEDVEGFLLSYARFQAAFPEDIRRQGCAQDPLEMVVTLTDERDALREDKARLDWLDMRERVTWSAAEKDPMDMRITPIRDALDVRRSPTPPAPKSSPV
jgi:hypothetical protein